MEEMVLPCVAPRTPTRVRLAMTVTLMSAPRSNAETVPRSEAVPTSGTHQLICVTDRGRGMASEAAENPPLLIGRASAAKKPLLIVRYLRRGWKPRPFKTLRHGLTGLLKNVFAGETLKPNR